MYSSYRSIYNHTLLTLLSFYLLHHHQVNGQALTSSTPSLTPTNLIGVSCASSGLSSYCIAGGDCCPDSTCCGIGLQCVADSSTNGYNCQSSPSSSGSGGSSSDDCVTSSISCSNYRGDRWSCKFGQFCGTVIYFCAGTPTGCLGGIGSGSGSSSSSSSASADESSSATTSTTSESAGFTTTSSTTPEAATSSSAGPDSGPRASGSISPASSGPSNAAAATFGILGDVSFAAMGLTLLVCAGMF